MNVRQLLDLGGRVALVTGGSRGLGLQIAEALGEMGAKIAITARKKNELDDAVARLASAHWLYWSEDASVEGREWLERVLALPAAPLRVAVLTRVSLSRLLRNLGGYTEERPRELLEEAPGIFNWALEGLDRLRERFNAVQENIRALTDEIAEEENAQPTPEQATNLTALNEELEALGPRIDVLRGSRVVDDEICSAVGARPSR